MPRAGTNHPATLELYDDIGLYKRLEPRGIVAPLFQYWDRGKSELIAEFNHAAMKDDTRFPFALQCERIKIVEEALAMAKANPLITVLMGTAFTGFDQDTDEVTAFFENEAGEKDRLRGRYIVSCEGARSPCARVPCGHRRSKRTGPAVSTSPKTCAKALNLLLRL